MNQDNKQLSVLVVEDSRTQAQALQNTLESLCINSLLARDLSGAKELLSKSSFDAIMLDLVLPDSAGLQTLTKMLAEVSHLPIIVMTSLDEESLGIEALRLGAQDYLSKSDSSPAAISRSLRYAVERKKQQEMLKQSGVKTRKILEMSYDPFVTLNTEGRIIEWNVRAERVFGWRKEELIGQIFLEKLVAPKYRKELESIFDELRQGEPGTSSQGRCEIEIICISRELLPVETAFCSVQVGEEISLCSFLQDITERKTHEQLMRDFYAIVSHELRSPLASIRSSMRLVQDGIVGEVPPEVMEMATLVNTSCDRLLRLVNELLDLSKIESGRVEVNLEETHPEDLVATVVSTLRGLSSQAKVRVTSKIRSHAPVLADQDKIIQVLTNLVANAIKFSPEESEVTVTVDDSSSSKVRFSIEDNGPGIPEQVRHKLFNKYQTVGSTDQRNFGGTGLGLAIAKALVSHHNGEIGVSSNSGCGATFWFEIPVAGKVRD